MANKMLIDATHPEETRVVVVRGNRVEEFDFESASRRQLRGNIYLAKVTRVEPSLQAAFVEYGGNRHGFLAFGEIHPDYYQIPMADRQALIAEEERAQREADDEAERRAGRRRGRGAERRSDRIRSERLADAEAPEPESSEAAEAAEASADLAARHEAGLADTAEGGEPPSSDQDAQAEPVLVVREAVEEQQAAQAAESAREDASPAGHAEHADADAAARAVAEEEREHEDHESPPVATEHEGEISEPHDEEHAETLAGNGRDDNGEDEEVVESVGGDDALEEATDRMPRIRRQYKIQEVIKRRQIMLVQVVKEERGTKGAALTTYLSLAGRYSVLMPNTARGGGISRKITNAVDRKRLKEIAEELEVPEGMGVILRTAGANRTKAEVKRDFEYLLRLWESVRDLTLKSTAPTLVYEEGSLIKRSIRDLYNKDIDEVLVAGDEAYREAKDFMRTLMPSHAKNVKTYRDGQPMFTRYGVESQLDAMFSPVVQLKSGGYIVLNQAEALVAIDVNSGRATREHHIEDTALKTNQEAADEIARQLRLRDLAGLIVIDFIDMDEKRNNRSVERRLKEALKHDRARIQVGRISHFGLLEMSRQRIRSSVLESSTEKCAQCGGTGHVRSVASVTLQLLRSLEEMLIKGATHNLAVRTRTEVALYVLNQKRAHLRELETRFRIGVTIAADPTTGGQQPFVIERGEQVHSVEAAKAIAAQAPSPAAEIEIEEPEAEEETVEEASAETVAEPEAANGERRGRRRRRRPRRGGEERDTAEPLRDFPSEALPALEDAAQAAAEGEAEEAEEPELAGAREQNGDAASEAERRRRRRGRRGGRRNRRDREGGFGLGESSPTEPELTSAVADFDQGPVAREMTPTEMAPTELMTPSASIESEPSGPPPAASHEAILEPASPPPVETPIPPPDSQPQESEPPRRRSTIREPAPFAIGSAEAPVVPPPAPIPQATVVVESSEQKPEEGEQPRRTGWWSRRFMGGAKS